MYSGRLFLLIIMIVSDGHLTKAASDRARLPAPPAEGSLGLQDVHPHNSATLFRDERPDDELTFPPIENPHESVRVNRDVINSEELNRKPKIGVVQTGKTFDDTFSFGDKVVSKAPSDLDEVTVIAANSIPTSEFRMPTEVPNISPNPQLSSQTNLPDTLGSGPNAATPTPELENIGMGLNAPESVAGTGKRRVDDTRINCQENYVNVTFKFATPFSGIIYPHNHFSECLLFAGANHISATLTLKHGTCGVNDKFVKQGQEDIADPTFEHHLMIQWEQDFVSEDDSSVTVRCERPDDFNKTISWNLGAGELQSSHPGPQLWMTIERGEGPRAAPLGDEVVRVGDVMTLVFTLAHSALWFDANVLACHAFDGSSERRPTAWQVNGTVQPRLSYSGQMLVVENGCSAKPKLFSHFYKLRETSPEGRKTSMYYAHFKAFKFPTSPRLQLECELVVCYRGCPQMQPCSVAFHPRSPSLGGGRARRSTESATDPEARHELERVTFRRAIEVRMRDDSLEGRATPLTASADHGQESTDGLSCYPPNVFFGTVITLSVSVILLALLLILCTFRSASVRPVFFTPAKRQSR